MTDVAARLAAAAGDATALLALAIELAQDNARLSSEAATLESRRKRDADRKSRARKSEDFRGNDVTSVDVTGPLPPSPSSSFPTPHITPSSPPIPPPPAVELGPNETALRALCGEEHYPDVAAYLAQRPPEKRDDWASEFRMLIGPVTGGLPEDLSRTCRDAHLADPPVKNAGAFRRFFQSCKYQRQHGSFAESGSPARSFGRSSVDAQAYAAAASDWEIVKTYNLLTAWPREELHRIGDTIVAAGRFPSREAFLGWYGMIKPVDLREARTDRWAVEQIIERRKTPQRAAS